ncbi:uncharacterized protein PHACADRAFT_52253, partial [Phanerochaete carnosa HHB-10118-sp]
QGHTDTVCSLSFSPKDYIVVSGSDDKSAIVWDVRSGHGRLRLEGHGGQVNAVVYAPHGELIATGSRDDNPVKIWDASTGACHTSPINSLSFSPNGRNLVSGSVDTSAIIWDVRSGRVLQRLEAHSNSVVEVAYAPNGVLVATASDHDASVKIWDASTGTCLQSLNGSSLSFSPNSQTLLSGSGNTSTIIWDVRDGHILLRLEGHTEPVTTVAYAPRGLLIVTASKCDRSMKIWDALTGACMQSV